MSEIRLTEDGDKIGALWTAFHHAGVYPGSLSDRQAVALYRRLGEALESDGTPVVEVLREGPAECHPGCGGRFGKEKCDCGAAVLREILGEE